MASGMPRCAERDALKERFDEAKILYAGAVRNLDENFGDGFDTAYKAAETARLQFEADRNALAAHVAQHGC